MWKRSQTEGNVSLVTLSDDGYVGHLTVRDVFGSVCEGQLCWWCRREVLLEVQLEAIRREISFRSTIDKDRHIAVAGSGFDLGVAFSKRYRNIVNV
jgi:hypothetical protein